MLKLTSASLVQRSLCFLIAGKFATFLAPKEQHLLSNNAPQKQKPAQTGRAFFTYYWVITDLQLKNLK